MSFRSSLICSSALLLLIGCDSQKNTSQYGICADVCEELYQSCSYAAYPSYDSCLAGCAYNEEEGADMESQLSCFQEAECDTFAIIECENQFGASSDK